jgi:hypothetical protein
MLFQISCREAAALILQGEDRPLTLAERVKLRLHLTICDPCPRFLRQVRVMHQAVDRWKHYRDETEAPAPPDDPGDRR